MTRPALSIPLLLALALLAPAASRAQDPSFVFVPPEATPEAHWNAKAQAGLTLNSGNTQGVAVSGSLLLSRRAGDDQLAGEIAGSFARNRTQQAVDSNDVPGIGPDEVRDVVQTTTAAWTTKLRYDRFFGTRHSVYGAISAAGDEPAGKRLLASLQLGYSHALWTSATQTTWFELGYDFAHQDFVSAPESITIHSARAFAGYQLKPSQTASIVVGAEMLTNLAPEDGPTGIIDAFHDNRASGRLELSVKVNDHGQLAMRLRARYDSSPAPRPPPPGTSWEPGYVPLAERLDTSSELVFIYSFL